MWPLAPPVERRRTKKGEKCVGCLMMTNGPWGERQRERWVHRHNTVRPIEAVSVRRVRLRCFGGERVGTGGLHV